MKLRYSLTSPYVRKVMVAAYETGVEPRIERIPTAVAPTKPSGEIAAENPLAKVPSMVTEDGQVLFDSPVICEYIDSCHGGAKLFPAEGPARWTALRQQALADGMLDAGLLRRYELTRPAGTQWAEWDAGQARKVTQALDALEAEAATLSGPVTIGQIAIACALGYLDFRFDADKWRQGRPRLAAWYDAFAKRPSMTQTVPKDQA